MNYTFTVLLAIPISQKMIRTEGFIVSQKREKAFGLKMNDISILLIMHLAQLHSLSNRRPKPYTP